MTEIVFSLNVNPFTVTSAPVSPGSPVEVNAEMLALVMPALRRVTVDPLATALTLPLAENRPRFESIETLPLSCSNGLNVPEPGAKPTSTTDDAL